MLVKDEPIPPLSGRWSRLGHEGRSCTRGTHGWTSPSRHSPADARQVNAQHARTPCSSHPATFYFKA